MNIDGKEHNPQMDEAYLLLGKARYFDQRFVPALEALNYILYKYPASDKINQAKVWREKANIRLDNNELAIENLKRLLKQEDLEGQDLADATSILAQAYLNEKVVDTAITQLEIASYATKNNDERGRYRFIQGQLYNKLGFKDSANLAFDKVIKLNRKTPRIYMISAYLEKVKNFDFENGNKLELMELLSELEENRENRPFLDKIYHQIGAFHLTNGSDSLATDYYNKSLRTNSRDKFLKARNYEILGDMNFDASVYADAGEYYDSTMSNLVLNSKPYRIIKRKRENLKDVIYYEAIAKANDSVLRLVHLPEADRLAYFQGVVDDLTVDVLASASEEERFDPEFYISKIPSGEKVVDSISKERNYAYYQLGLIYKEKFKEYELSKSKFQNLLQSNPEDKLILPSKYNLLRIYELLGETDEASIAKADIIAKYPDSRYASILKNPELVSERDENSPESLYEALYVQHENQEYLDVVSKSEAYIKTFDGESMVPKFELLKAIATGRLYGFEAYNSPLFCSFIYKLSNHSNS